MQEGRNNGFVPKFHLSFHFKRLLSENKLFGLYFYIDRVQFYKFSQSQIMLTLNTVTLKQKPTMLWDLIKTFIPQKPWEKDFKACMFVPVFHLCLRTLYIICVFDLCKQLQVWKYLSAYEKCLAKLVLGVIRTPFFFLGRISIKVKVMIGKSWLLCASNCKLIAV